MYQNELRVWPDILISIYGKVLGLNLHFLKWEKLLEGGGLRVRSTHGNASRYQVTINSPVVMYGHNASLMLQVSHRNSKYCYLVPHLSILRFYPYVVFVSYIVQTLLILSPVICMHTSSLGLKNYRGHPNSRDGMAAVWGWNPTTS